MSRQASMVAIALCLLTALPAAFAQQANNSTASDEPTIYHTTAQAPDNSSADNGTQPVVARPPSHAGPCPTDVDCTGGTKPAGSSNCMDGQQGNETCDPNVYYMAPPGGSPAPATSTGDSAQASSTKTVPGLGVFALFAAFAVAVVALARRQQTRR